MLGSETTKLPKPPKITAKQEGGDDGYCYVVRVNGVEFVNGLTRSEVSYYKRRALESWKEKHEHSSKINPT